MGKFRVVENVAHGILEVELNKLSDEGYQIIHLLEGASIPKYGDDHLPPARTATIVAVLPSLPGERITKIVKATPLGG